MRGKGQTTSTDARSGWLRRLSRACWRYPRNLMLALAGTLVVSLVGISIPLIQRAIVDNLTSSTQAAIWPLAVALLVAAAANFAGLYVRRYRGGQLSLDVQHDLRTRLFSALSRLDGTRQDELHTGQIVSRSISDLSMIQSLTPAGVSTMSGVSHKRGGDRFPHGTNGRTGARQVAYL